MYSHQDPLLKMNQKMYIDHINNKIIFYLFKL